MITRAIIVIAGAIAILFTVASHARAEVCTQPTTTICTARMCFPMTPTCNKCTAESVCTRDDGTVYVKAIDDHAISGTFTFTMERLSTSAKNAHVETCIASQYGIGDGYHGKRTASGAIFNTHATSPYTVAHKTRALGSFVMVTNLANGKSIRALVNDRGPFVRGRCVDLGRAGANAIGMGGTARVRVE